MTVPYVIEGDGRDEKVYDLYSRLLRDRIIFIGSELDESVAKSVVAQLLFLEADDSEKDITIYINSPGGYVSAAFAIFDTMQYIKPDVSTICIGQAASAASFLLAAGTKGKRFALKNARIMLHQVSSGAAGHVQDLKIAIQETEILNARIIEELAILTGHTVKEIKKDIDRDYYLGAQEAKEYGLIDDVFVHRGK